MTAATIVRNVDDIGEFSSGEVVTYLDLDGDGVPDAVRTTKITHLPEPVAGQGAHVLEKVEAVDDDGSVRLLSLTERYVSGRTSAIA